MSLHRTDCNRKHSRVILCKILQIFCVSVKIDLNFKRIIHRTLSPVTSEWSNIKYKIIYVNSILLNPRLNKNHKKKKWKPIALLFEMNFLKLQKLPLFWKELLENDAGFWIGYFISSSLRSVQLIVDRLTHNFMIQWLHP